MHPDALPLDFQRVVIDYVGDAGHMDGVGRWYGDELKQDK
ncbi:hypothetical protein LOKVESSMR4R_02299 [Yoonia vestfoldensis]|uniref:Uncharacterized protein n=1 Tax=Yoonia vestfoldensis TaxID=245188 RepID=A0A1Y0EDD7_9RHOB|nr:hypothetical protein LOKVESSMR4R_02299 [Yoonia vestfoldensis]